MGRERENTDGWEQKENPSFDARLTVEKGEAVPLVSKSKHGRAAATPPPVKRLASEFLSFFSFSYLSAHSAALWQGVLA